MRVGRRDALRTLGVLGAASAAGCAEPTPIEPTGDAGETGDAGSTPGDAGTDAGRELRDAGPAPTGPFRHGVASGDPLPGAVILWTRITTTETEAQTVAWQVSTSADFATLAAMGEASASAARDWTVKVDVGELAPATTYYYRFALDAPGGFEYSPIGRTRTAPAAEAAVDSLKFAVCSCSNYAFGYFHAYRDIARRADLDAVIHLGDYIYEYETNGYGRLRPCEPEHEIVSLADYRARYAQYRADPDLAEVHRQHPFIVVWDDHETADNSYRDGAKNHEEEDGEGAWADRKAAAQQAYDEWMPIRSTDPNQIWRGLTFGDLVDLTMLDTRLEGRDQQGSGTDADRALLSDEQLEFLLGRLRDSPARWKVIAQQIVLSPFPFFENEDGWDGYPATQARLFEALREDAIEDVVVLTGDIHTSWGFEVVDNPTATPLPAPLAVEFVTPGITSPGIGEALEDAVRTSIEANGPHVKYWDVSRRGYYLLDLTPARANVSYRYVLDITAPYDVTVEAGAAFDVATGTSRIVPGDPAADRAGAPPLAP